MIDLARYEGRHRIRGSVSLSVAVSLLAATVIWIYPSFSGSFENIDEELLQAYPDQVIDLFGVRTMSSIEGFLAFELYVFGWLILLGLYLAYLGAGSIAADVERERMDVLLALPISRARVVLETFASLSVPIVAVNVLTPVVVYVGARLIDDPIPAVDVAAVHLLSIPYLFACAGVGLLASVVFDRASIAQRVALGVVFGLFMLESLLDGTDYGAVGAVSPARYYDPNAILLEEGYDLAGAAILVATTAGLLVASVVYFRRRDL